MGDADGRPVKNSSMPWARTSTKLEAREFDGARQSVLVESYMGARKLSPMSPGNALKGARSALSLRNLCDEELLQRFIRKPECRRLFHRLVDVPAIDDRIAAGVTAPAHATVDSTLAKFRIPGTSCLTTCALAMVATKHPTTVNSPSHETLDGIPHLL
jgi:hypothetical protein